MTNAVGESVEDSDQLMIRLKQYGEMKDAYDKIKDALDSVKAGGYGVVIPQREDITLEEPEIIHQRITSDLVRYPGFSQISRFFR